ncbi:MAG: hypothetical protein ACXWVD_00115 [Telluria sp.]
MTTQQYNVTIYVTGPQLSASEIAQRAGDMTDDEAATLHRIVEGRDARAIAGYPTDFHACGNALADVFCLHLRGNCAFDVVPLETDDHGDLIYPDAAQPYLHAASL